MARTPKQLAEAKARQAANKAKDAGKSLSALKSSLSKPKASDVKSKSSKSVYDPYSSSEYKGISKSLSESMNPTQEELAASKSLGDIEQEQANLGLSTKLGIQNVEGQAIPMGFVTGQTAALNKASGLASEAISQKALPLKTQLANLQAKRQAAQDIAKQQMSEYQAKVSDERARQAAAESARQFGLTQSENIRQFDVQQAEKAREFNAEQARLRSTAGTTASTKKSENIKALLTKAANMSSGGDQWAIKNAGLYGLQPQEVQPYLQGNWGDGYRTGSESIDQNTINYYVNGLINGNIKLENVPANIRNSVASQVGSKGNIVTAPDGTQIEIID